MTRQHPPPVGLGPPIINASESHTHTHTHTTLGINPLNERSARRRDIYLTTRNIQRARHPCPSVGFEPAMPARSVTDIAFI
jgi:hypothetical protein